MSHDPSAELTAALALMAGVSLVEADPVPMLAAIAHAASVLSESADAAAVGWSTSGRGRLVAATDDVARKVEDLQQSLDEGPVIDALRAGGSRAGGNTTWRRLGPQAGRAGFRSLIAHAVVAGPDWAWISLYSRSVDAFVEPTPSVLTRFAAAVGVQIDNAQRLERARRTADQATRELAEGAVIERAVGILMSRRGIDPDSALTRLRMLSQRSNVRLAVVAANIVDEAVNRARTRPSLPD